MYPLLLICALRYVLLLAKDGRAIMAFLVGEAIFALICKELYVFLLQKLNNSQISNALLCITSGIVPIGETKQGEPKAKLRNSANNY